MTNGLMKETESIIVKTLIAQILYSKESAMLDKDFALYENLQKD